MRQIILKFSNNPFVKGGALLFVSGLLGSFLNYLFNLIAAKRLGPAGYGEVVALISYAVIFSVPFSVMTTELIKRLGSYKGNKFEKINAWESWGLANLYKYKIILILYGLLVFVLPSVTNLTVFAIITLLVLLFLAVIISFYLGSLQGAHLFLSFAIITVISSFIKFAGAVALFLPYSSIYFIYIFLLISYIIPIIISRWYIKKNTPTNVVFKSNQRIKSLILSRSMLLTIFSIAGITLISNFDIIYVKKFFPPSQSGIYGAWTIFAKIVMYVIGPVQMISLIFFSSREQKKYHLLGLVAVIAGVALVAICLHIIYITFGNQVLTLLFSADYKSVVPLMRYAAVFGFLYSAIIVLNNFFLTRNSVASLITMISIPIYAVLLHYFGTSLERIIHINIYVTVAILGISLAVLIKTLVFKPSV